MVFSISFQTMKQKKSKNKNKIKFLFELMFSFFWFFLLLCIYFIVILIDAKLSYEIFQIKKNRNSILKFLFLFTSQIGCKIFNTRQTCFFFNLSIIVSHEKATSFATQATPSLCQNVIIILPVFSVEWVFVLFLFRK